MIDNYPADQVEYFDLPNNPTAMPTTPPPARLPLPRKSGSTRATFLRFPPKFKRLTLGSEVRLDGRLPAPHRRGQGRSCNVVTIHAEADLETRNGNPADGRKVRGTIHWVS